MDRRNAQLDRDLVREVKRRKDLHNALEDLKGRIRVYLRVRPMNDKEKTAHEVCCERSGQTGVVVKRPDRKPPQDRPAPSSTGCSRARRRHRGLRGRQGSGAVVRRRF